MEWVEESEKDGITAWRLFGFFLVSISFLNMTGFERRLQKVIKPSLPAEARYLK